VAEPIPPAEDAPRRNKKKDKKFEKQAIGDDLGSLNYLQASLRCEFL
jgi:hypothetical protein